MPPPLNFQTVIPASEAGYLGSYVELPVFNYDDITWLGASQKILQFNYTADRNFVLKKLPIKPTGVNYLLVIKFRIGMIVYRYKLWQGLDEVLPEPLYAGQVIKKNFVLEVWSIPSSTSVSQAAVLNIELGLRKVPDYTYADLSDYDAGTGALVSPSSMWIAGQTVSSPILTGLKGWYKADASDQLEDLSGNGNDYNGNFVAEADTLGTNLIASGTWSGGGPTNTIVDPTNIFFIVKPTSWIGTADLASFGVGPTYLEQYNVTPKVRYASPYGNSAEFDLPLNAGYIIEFVSNSNPGEFGDTNRLYIYDLAGGSLLTSLTTGVFVTGLEDIDQFSMYFPCSEVLAYTTILSEADKATMLDYFMQRYNTGTIIENLEVTGDEAWLDNS